MNFANDYDIHRWQQHLNAATGFPNLGRAADNLDALRDWANDNSDGWAYWPKPVRAAQRLIALLEDAERAARDYRRQGTDCSEADVRAALVPVKAFLTRQGVRHEDVIL